MEEEVEMSTQDHQKIPPVRMGINAAFLLTIVGLVVLLFLPSFRDIDIFAAAPAVGFILGIILGVVANQVKIEI